MVVSNGVNSFKQRKATVQERYRQRKYLLKGGIMVPELCVRGLWLGRLGFEAGARVIVDYVDDKLVISLAPQETESVEKAG